MTNLFIRKQFLYPKSQNTNRINSFLMKKIIFCQVKNVINKNKNLKQERR